MNPYQVMGIIASCTIVFGGVVTLLAMQGVPLLLAFLGVYLFAVWVMLSMQRKATEVFEGKHYPAQRYYDRHTAARRVRINDLGADTEVLSVRQLQA